MIIRVGQMIIRVGRMIIRPYKSYDALTIVCSFGILKE
jgi:hypothetical protein